MAATIETHGPVTVNGAANNFIGDVGQSSCSSPNTPSKGIVKVSLKKNGTALASAQVSMNTLGSSLTPMIWLSAGAEGDNGSTSTLLKYFYNSADVAQYTVDFDISGKMDIVFDGVAAGASQLFYATGNGQCSISFPLSDGI